MFQRWRNCFHSGYQLLSPCKLIHKFLPVLSRTIVQELDQDFMQECMKMALSPEILEVMQEDAKTKNERQRLNDKLDRLLRAQEMLQTVQ